jgi:hypothetical protein
VFPTILDYLGLPIPAGTQGHMLLEASHPVVSEQHYARNRVLFSTIGHRFDRVLRTIRLGEHRYFQGSNGEERLFHITLDPRETTDLIGERPELAAAARASLEQWLESTPAAKRPGEPSQLADPDTLDNLRALGYVH